MEPLEDIRSIRLTDDDLARSAKDLPLKVIRRLGHQLHRQLNTGGNWEILAEELGYEYDDIKRLTAIANIRQEVTPGELLLREWADQPSSGHTLFVLHNALCRIDRLDCAEYMTTEVLNMRDFCDEKNATLLFLDSPGKLDQMKQLLIPRENGQLIINDAQLSYLSSSDDRKLAVQQCMLEAGLVFPNDLLQGTYRDMVVFAQSLGTPLNCPEVEQWEPGGLNVEEDCTAYGLETGYRLRSVSCTWQSGEYSLACGQQSNIQ